MEIGLDKLDSQMEAIELLSLTVADTFFILKNPLYISLKFVAYARAAYGKLVRDTSIGF